MDPTDIKKLRALTSFESLVDYLRDELDWPIETDDAEKLSFQYDSQELGIDPLQAVKIESIRQIRPLAEKQPWGVFYIEFESKQLPVMALRRILQSLVPASRNRDPNRPAWRLNDLLFISSQGADTDRSISFAHFRQDQDGKHELRTFSWDVHENHLYYIKNLNLEALRWPTDSADSAAWRTQWSSAFTVIHRYVPTTAQMLAEEMARIARQIRENVLEIYRLEHVGGPLHQLHLSLKLSLINDLTADDFADMYAQTITYGLFAARATRQGDFAAADTAALIAHSNPFLRELMQQLTNQETVDLDGLGVSELTELLKLVNMEAILQDFGRQKRGEDPVIHFYETFMRKYDPKQKTRRGEFYTPDAVVSFIVRSVDYLLRTEFDCPDGLMTVPKNPQAFTPVILDPATGTGTFLKYVIGVVWDEFFQKHKNLSNEKRKAKWQEYVPASLLPRLYGFELKMAPYTIAHLKLGLALKETGYELKEGERLQVYLSNTLQPAHEVARVDTPALAHEVQQANEVKAKSPITIVLGNPPYAGHSSNASRDSIGNLNFIGNLLQDYFKVDGKPLGEKNPKWLQDDYVKFIRFAQWRIQESGTGIVAMITNHGFLDNPTFRGMRQQLMKTFDKIYLLDLHGNAKKKETTLDGSKDENVFDIQQGVSICLMVKLEKATSPAKVFHADLFGLREFKSEWLITHHRDLGSIKWNLLSPQSPFYLFAPQDIELRAEFESYWKITELLPVNSVGIVTARDSLTIHWTRDEVWETVNDFSSLSVDNARLKYNLGKDARDWKVAYAQQDLINSKLLKNKIEPVYYRPFDTRHTYYTGRSRGFICMPRPDVMNHLRTGNNISLLICRQQSHIGFRHVLCSRNISECCAVSLQTREIDYVFPLYLYRSNDNHHQKKYKQTSLFNESLTIEPAVRLPNISPEFISELEKKFRLNFTLEQTGDLQNTFGPLDIFNYVYCILHSPAYRQRYAEFLKIDFPRLPITSNLEFFSQLCKLGSQLVALHLLEDSRLQQGAPELEQVQFHFDPGVSVAAGFPKYEYGRVLVNREQYFEGVPEEVWSFYIGGYQVCHKWLKDRRGRQLSAEDILHYKKIVVALGETIRLMEQIDEAIDEHGGWPIQ